MSTMIPDIPRIIKTNWLSIIVASAGLLSLYIGNKLEQWHSKKFDEHTDNLEKYHKEGDDEGVRKELKRFREDDRIIYALDGMTALYVIGVLLIMIAFLLL